MIVSKIINRVFSSSGEQSRFWRRSLSSDVRRTALYDFNVSHGAKMMEFHGWSMPSTYNLPLSEAHRFVRSHAGIFDVSHMLQFVIHGDDSVTFLESLVPTSLKQLQNNKSAYTAILNDNGGIEDDLIITKINSDHFYCVSNAARAPIVLKIIDDNIKKYKDAYLQKLTDRALISIQGPYAASLIKSVIDTDLDKMGFMSSTNTILFGIPVRLNRCGYTGEDGFEISIPNNKAHSIVSNLFEVGGKNVTLCGLLNRDSLRIEAGLCLYGHDINSNTTPVEANINFILSKDRRERLDFPGCHKILEQLKQGTKTKRVGFLAENRIPRENQTIFNIKGQEIGRVTSGTRSPILEKNIGMGYVITEMSQIGQKIKIGSEFSKSNEATVTALPFIPSKYYIVKK